jgi:excinuclease ABC subunit C
MPELNNIQNENTKELHRNHEEVIEREFSAIMDRGNEIEDNTTGEIGDEIKFNQLLLEKINGLPAKPGVYQYKNRAGKIIYVGKAIKLRNRVKSYFLNGKIFDAKTKALRKHIYDMEYIITDTETEALILENTLIKDLKPKYNILLKDDKTYPYIRITNEYYPRIFSTRTLIKDGSKYFGPFTDLKGMNNVLTTLRKIFRFRSCEINITSETISNQKHKVCLDYHINKCDGPCEGKISSSRYNEYVKNAQNIINGNTRELEQKLEALMTELAEDLKFEEANAIKYKLLLVKEYSSKQKIVTTDLIDRDIIGLYIQDEMCCSLVFKIREGKLIGKRHFIFHNVMDSDAEELIGRTLQAWYSETDFIPSEIYLPNDFEDIEQVSKWLAEKKGRAVNIQIPKIGDKKKLIDMANKNAEFILKEEILALDRREQVIPRAVLSLQRDLRLAKPPQIIECFDNSHMQGSELVSSMVRFVDGKPKKSEYRKYKNKTVLRNDDFAAMREVVFRRYSRIIEENEQGMANATKMPDLIMIDGGKGQLSSAFEIIKELGLDKKVIVIGLAKRLEEVFFPYESEAVLLPRTSSSLRLIQQVRDEAHRFAITFHRSLRDKRTLQTELTEIKGIGKKTADTLLTEVGSVRRILELDDEELSKYLNQKQIAALKEHFKEKIVEGEEE